MNTCTYDGDATVLTRSHPYTHATSDAAARYLDLRASPALIRTALEDFVPWSGHPAVDHFYLLLERLNGPRSTLESNDCAFSPPQPDADAPLHRRFTCSGRLMVLFRHLPRNDASEWGAFTHALHVALAAVDTEFDLGVLGTTLVPVRFRLLPASFPGFQLMVSFWAWGDSEPACLDNLARLMTNLSPALLEVDAG
jgi:hypothetical protein